ncbi:MAG: S8 family serine peptidase [Patescibacteria group bacterium]
MSKVIGGVLFGIALILHLTVADAHAATLQPYRLVLTRQAGGLESRVVAAPSLSAALAQARALPGVVAAEPDVTYRMAGVPNDPDYTQQAALSTIGAPTAWNTRTDASSVVVAVLDSGVDITNPDLAGNLWTNPKEIAGNSVDDDANGYVDDVHGWNFIEGSRDPRPQVTPGATVAGINHGTVIAGIIGAQGNNGVAGTGVAWEATIMAVRVLDSTGSGSTVTVAQGVRYAVAAGAKIINLSFVGEGTSATLVAALDEAHAAGVLVIAAAGNEGVDLDSSPRYPACYAGVIGVGSVSPSNTRSTFSNYGSCVDIAAPGENVYSTFFYSPDQGYSQVSGAGWYGTSVASPFVAGAAVLLRAAGPDLGVDAVEALLKQSAFSLAASEPTYAAKLGAGRLHIATLLDSVQLAQFAKQNILTFPLLGDTPRVREYAATGKVQRQFLNGSNAGARADGFVTAGNVSGDAQEEYVTSFGKGVEPRLRVFNRLGKQLRSFLAYPTAFRGGVVHATGDLDGDGTEEIVVGTATGSAQVRVFNGSGTLIRQFFAFTKTYTGGVRVAVADTDGNGTSEIIISKFAKDPRVAIFSGGGTLQRSFRVFPTNITTGVTLTAGDLTADGKAEIIVGLATGSPRVRIFNSTGTLQREFAAYATSQRGGVNLATGDIDGDGTPDIITGTGPGAKPEVRVFTNLGRTRLAAFNAYSARSTTGITVGTISAQ